MQKILAFFFLILATSTTLAATMVTAELSGSIVDGRLIYRATAPGVFGDKLTFPQENYYTQGVTFRNFKYVNEQEKPVIDFNDYFAGMSPVTLILKSYDKNSGLVKFEFNVSQYIEFCNRDFLNNVKPLAMPMNILFTNTNQTSLLLEGVYKKINGKGVLKELNNQSDYHLSVEEDGLSNQQIIVQFTHPIAVKLNLDYAKVQKG